MPTALVIDAPNGLVERLLRDSGVRVLRSMSRTLVEKHGLWMEPVLESDRLPEMADAIAFQPVFLGSDAATIEYLEPVQVGLLHSPPEVHQIRIETLAQMVENLRALDFVYINDADYLVEVIAGLRPVGKERQPVVVVPGFAHLDPACQTAVRSHLVAMNYRLSDGRPLAEWSGNDGWELIVFPSERGDRESWRSQLWDRSMLQQISEKLRLSDRQLEYVLADVVAENWYGVESDSVECWRWSGPGAEARMLLPILNPGNYSLRASFRAVADNSLWQTANVFIDGKFCPEVSAAWVPGNDVVVSFTVTPEEWTGFVEFLIALPCTYRPNIKDVRLLGVAISKVSLQWNP